jgi:translation elongation factor EF-1alpha
VLSRALQLLYRRKVERMRGCTLSLCVRNFSTPKYEVSITDVPGESKCVTAGCCGSTARPASANDHGFLI